MVLHVAEIDPRLGVDAGQFLPRQLLRHFAHRPKHPLEADQLAPDGEDAVDLGPAEEAVDRLGFHRQHFFLQVFDQGDVAIDDVIEDRVEQVIDAMHQQARRLLQLLAQRGVRTGRPMANADDVAVADEDGGFAIVDVRLLQVRGTRDDEQLVVINVDLGQLVSLDRILYRQRVQPVAIGEAVHLVLCWIGNSDPDEFALDVTAVDPLVD